MRRRQLPTMTTPPPDFLWRVWATTRTPRRPPRRTAASPAEVGNLAAKAVLDFRHNDGSNQLTATPTPPVSTTAEEQVEPGDRPVALAAAVRAAPAAGRHSLRAARARSRGRSLRSGVTSPRSRPRRRSSTCQVHRRTRTATTPPPTSRGPGDTGTCTDDQEGQGRVLGRRAGVGVPAWAHGAVRPGPVPQAPTAWTPTRSCSSRSATRRWTRASRPGARSTSTTSGGRSPPSGVPLPVSQLMARPQPGLPMVMGQTGCPTRRSTWSRRRSPSTCRGTPRSPRPGRVFCRVHWQRHLRGGRQDPRGSSTIECYPGPDVTLSWPTFWPRPTTLAGRAAMAASTSTAATTTVARSAASRPVRLGFRPELHQGVPRQARS